MQEVAQLKAERQQRKKAISMYEFMLWSQANNQGGGGGGGGAVGQLMANMRQCKYCSRLFTQEKMAHHCAKRHPGVQLSACCWTSVDSPQVSCPTKARRSEVATRWSTLGITTWALTKH